jgi:hypothetical protein
MIRETLRSTNFFKLIRRGIPPAVKQPELSIQSLSTGSHSDFKSLPSVVDDTTFGLATQVYTCESIRLLSRRMLFLILVGFSNK